MSRKVTIDDKKNKRDLLMMSIEEKKKALQPSMHIIGSSMQAPVPMMRSSLIVSFRYSLNHQLNFIPYDRIRIQILTLIINKRAFTL